VYVCLCQDPFDDGLAFYTFVAFGSNNDIHLFICNNDGWWHRFGEMNNEPFGTDCCVNRISSMVTYLNTFTFKIMLRLVIKIYTNCIVISQ
jgi:hypothetical protein